MDLWNEYEGRSIDGLFPLERLIRPEGRSAFFTTTSAGIATVIRLIESHFDEEEILARWTSVSELHEPNLLKMIRFGQAVMDETSLVYVVLEPTEGDLSQVLCDRPLTPTETHEVATSLISALQALHEKGFIHEHVQPVNVLAVGEVVKLRSDCIREAPEGAEGIALRARDVQDLATLLLQSLTQQRNPAISPVGSPLPAPFREIVHNGISGTWTLAQMAAALAASTPKPVVAPVPSATAPAPHNLQEIPRKPAAAAIVTGKKDPAPRNAPTPGKPELPRISVPVATAFPEPASGRIRVPMLSQSGSPQRWLVLLALLVVCLVLFAGYSLLHRNASKTEATAQALAPTSTQQVVPTAATSVAAGAEARVPASPAPLQTNAREEWRVVVYTYNRQDQAADKALVLKQRYASLHPAVFTPTGHAPYLVTIGGPLSRDAAFRLKNKLRGAGLPRDLYAQNYSGKSR